MCYKQIRPGEKDRERGMHLGGGARGILYRGGGVCEYEIDEMRGGSVHVRGTVLDRGGMDGEKRRGKACVCGRHTWQERHIERCVPGGRSWGPTHTVGE